MDSFLYWYSQNNKTIIQFISACIGLVLIYFIYRMFFAPAETAHGEANALATSKQLADLDKKITKRIDHQVQEIQPVAFTGDAAEYEASAKESAKESPAGESPAGESPTGENPAGDVQNQVEVNKLKKELQSSNEIILAKNAELNELKEKLIEYQKNAPVAQSAPADPNDPKLIAKIEELQKKLQEYDIISDDISELQSLRAENAELKSKIEEKSSAS